MMNSFEEYLDALKQRRDEDDYSYSDEDFEKYSDWVKTCWENNISQYKCLEMMWFEKEDKL